MYIRQIRIREHITTEEDLKTALKHRRTFRSVLYCKMNGGKKDVKRIC